VVYNPLSWNRTDIARWKVKVGEKVSGLRDLSTGTTVPVQSISDDEVAFLAKDVPSIGYRSYQVISGQPLAEKTPQKSKTTGLENQFLSLSVRPTDGAIMSIVDKSLNQELVDSSGDKGANQLLRWIPAENLPVGWPELNISRENGPVFSRLTIRRPGSLWPETELTLYDALPKLQITNTLDRDKMPFVASNQAGEYYSFQFPFRFKGSASVWLEDGIGFHKIPEDYLPGARTDAGAPLHSLVLSGELGGKQTYITLAQRESFFNYFPGLPGVKGPSTFMNSVRATVMRKQDQGDTRDWGMVNFSMIEPGLPAVSSYSFSLTANQGPLDAVTSYRQGLEENVPLIADRLDNAMAPATFTSSFFSLSSENVTLLAFKPSADGKPEHYILRLQEIAGKPAEAEIKTPLKVTEAKLVSMTEDTELGPVSATPLKVLLKPYETVTLQLTIPHPHKERSARWWEW